MAKDLRYVLLFDCYGELLTEKQREALELYYCDDLSLSEISEPRGISRQAVRDSIKRGEQQLDALEAKLGLAARLQQVRRRLDRIAGEAETLRRICEDPAVQAHLAQILADTAESDRLI